MNWLNYTVPALLAASDGRKITRRNPLAVKWIGMNTPWVAARRQLQAAEEPTVHYSGGQGMVERVARTLQRNALPASPSPVRRILRPDRGRLFEPGRAERVAARLAWRAPAAGHRVAEQAIAAIGERNAYCWATQSGAELDLLALAGSRRIGVEVKYADAPSLTKSMHVARADLGLHRVLIAYPGEKRYSLAHWAAVVPPAALIGELAALRLRTVPAPEPVGAPLDAVSAHTARPAALGRLRVCITNIGDPRCGILAAPFEAKTLDRPAQIVIRDGNL